MWLARTHPVALMRDLTSRADFGPLGSDNGLRRLAQMEVQVSTEVDRPVADVWRFYAVEHVRNHPRWDPDMHLEQISEGPIGVGTRIRRVNTRWGDPVEGEMEIVEFEPERAIATVIHDANMDMRGRATLEPRGSERTLLTVSADLPGLEDPGKMEFLRSMMQRSVDNVKRLIESEL
jgi:uncharacterized protein YndB with AHSA1/START domain